MKTEVGYRIRKLRESKDYSQENMAGELGISISAYSKIERGKTDPSIGRLTEIAKILDVEVTSFFETTSKNIAQDKPELFGYVTKYEFEEIIKQIRQIRQELATLQKPPLKKQTPKKRQSK